MTNERVFLELSIMLNPNDAQARGIKYWGNLSDTIGNVRDHVRNTLGYEEQDFYDAKGNRFSGNEPLTMLTLIRDYDSDGTFLTQSLFNLNSYVALLEMIQSFRHRDAALASLGSSYPETSSYSEPSYNYQPSYEPPPVQRNRPAIHATGAWTAAEIAYRIRTPASAFKLEPIRVQGCGPNPPLPWEKKSNSKRK